MWWLLTATLLSTLTVVGGASAGGGSSDPACPSQAPHFLAIGSLTKIGIKQYLMRAIRIKAKTKDRTMLYRPFEGLQLGMVFTKPSLRTRASFEAGFQRLGGGTSYFVPTDIALGKREAVKDVARVMSRFYDAIVARVHEHHDLEELACYSSVPVINALSNYNHPLQIMSDLLTITEHFKSADNMLEGKKVVYVGDCNNMVTSWLQLASRIPFTLGIACPKALDPPDPVALKMAQDAKVSEIIVSHSPQNVLLGADVVYADVWTSMGFKEQEAKRLSYFKGWTIDSKMMSLTGKNTTIFLHCLPAERGREVTDEVIEGPQSLVFPQAENRQHMQMAILWQLLKAKRNASK